MAKQQAVISSLTKEQEAKLPLYQEEFRKIGTCTRPTDRPKAEAALKRAYAYLSKSGPESKDPEIVWAESPIQGAILAAQYAKGNTKVTNKEVQEQASLASYGSFEAYWVSVYAFISNELPVEKDELADIAVDIVKECGIYWTFEDLVVVTPKPSVIHMKDDKLHCTTGAALAYPNGDKLFVVNGEIKQSLMEVVIAARNGDNGSSDEVA